jgi:hypothetical protein
MMVVFAAGPGFGLLGAHGFGKERRVCVGVLKVCETIYARNDYAFRHACMHGKKLLCTFAFETFALATETYSYV